MLRASTYGKGFEKRRTASGEEFDANALTAAHKSHPFGTLLRVSNPANQRSVLVRVNDRGPFVEGRALDLSTRAARELGIEQQGVALVKVEVVTQAAQAETQAIQQAPSARKGEKTRSPNAPKR